MQIKISSDTALFVLTIFLGLLTDILSESGFTVTPFLTFVAAFFTGFYIIIKNSEKALK